jgi:membrane protein involved in colicin uptake
LDKRAGGALKAQAIEDQVVAPNSTVHFSICQARPRNRNEMTQASRTESAPFPVRFASLKRQRDMPDPQKRAEAIDQQRIIDEEERRSAELERRAAEEERQQNERERAYDEEERWRGEAKRMDGEADREWAESHRAAAEEARAVAEEARRAAEDARRIAERARHDAEIALQRVADQEAIIGELRQSLRALREIAKNERAETA